MTNQEKIIFAEIQRCITKANKLLFSDEVTDETLEEIQLLHTGNYTLNYSLSWCQVAMKEICEKFDVPDNYDSAN